MMSRAPLGADDARFSCSICLETLRDPVTVPCGHSYCVSCLTGYWDRQRVCVCPQCRATFSPRPALGRNNLLVEMMQKLGAAGPGDGPSAPPAPGFPSPAERRGFEHAVFDVSSPLSPGTDGQLEDTRRRLAAQIKERDAELQQLKQSLRSFSRLAKAAVKDSSRIFSELAEFLERRRAEMKELIRAQEKAELTRAEHHLQRLEHQLSELRRRDGELERLTQTRDQNRDQTRITQICQSYRSPVAAETSAPQTVNPHVSFGPVRTAVSDLKEQLLRLYHAEFPSVASAVKSVNLLQMETNSAACGSAVPKPVPSLDDRNDLLQYFRPLTLDPFTAHRELSLTAGNRAAGRTGDVQDRPDHPDRFDAWCQALCREGLRGRCYWEAEWDGQQVALGLAYEGIGRKGPSDACRLGHNSVSWSLLCGSSSFVFCHGDRTLPVASGVPSSPGRIGVFLDHDAGLLCFYSVTAGRVRLLHRAEDVFRQPLYPALWLGARSNVFFCAVD